MKSAKLFTLLLAALLAAQTVSCGGGSPAGFFCGVLSAIMFAALIIFNKKILGSNNTDQLVSLDNITGINSLLIDTDSLDLL